jgi:hypothetical protein
MRAAATWTETNRAEPRRGGEGELPVEAEVRRGVGHMPYLGQSERLAARPARRSRASSVPRRRPLALAPIQ